MSKAKIAITIDQGLLDELDLLVKRQKFKNRSHAIQSSVREMLERLSRQRLALECAKLDPRLEQEFADES
jgi:Arc/MetJ-type ribon-helix-helix transcriptional regulator